jgi:transposase-like protein
VRDYALAGKGKLEVAEVCREHDLKQSEVDSWMEIPEGGAAQALTAIMPFLADA